MVSNTGYHLWRIVYFLGRGPAADLGINLFKKNSYNEENNMAVYEMYIIGDSSNNVFYGAFETL